MISYDEFYAAFRPPKVRMAAMDLLLFSVFQESILEKFGHLIRLSSSDEINSISSLLFNFLSSES